MRISDWSSDVCSSDLIAVHDDKLRLMPRDGRRKNFHLSGAEQGGRARAAHAHDFGPDDVEGDGGGQTNRLLQPRFAGTPRSEEHTSELQSLIRISYAVFCLKKKKTIKPKQILKIQFISNQSRYNK